jgi:membrane protease YdiL (CAAX protease family)
LTIAVSLTDSVKPHLTVLRFDYSHAKPFLLAAGQKHGLQDNLRGLPQKCSHQAMPWDFCLIFLFLGIVVPWRGAVRLKKLLALPSVSTKEKLVLYGSTIAGQWVITGLVAWRALARGLSPSALGSGKVGGVSAVLGSLALALVVGALHWLNLRRVGKSPGRAAELMRALAGRILPVHPVERFPYFALAVTAGVCEEFLYRGFAMGALARVGLPVWAVVILTAVLFGLAHAYQGRSGILGTFVMGILLGVVRLAYDSIVPVIMMHAAMDLVAGIAGPRYLLLKVPKVPG